MMIDIIHKTFYFLKVLIDYGATISLTSFNGTIIIPITFQDDDDSILGVDHEWAGLLASIGLLITSVVELLISGYTCVRLAPRLCGCLRGSTPPSGSQGQLKTHNMVHQWVSSHPKSQQIYLVQPMMSVQPVLQVRSSLLY